MRVLLINPYSVSPQPIMPLGLAYLAAELLENNIEVSVIDAWAERLDFRDLEKRISKTGEYDLIGVTVMSPVYRNAVKTIQAAKRAAPNAKIIIGGTHPSSLPEEGLQDNPEIDFAAVGEADLLIVQLVNALSGTKYKLSEIKGLVYRDSGKIVNNGRADPIKNLDNLPFPARHLFPIDKYETHPPYRLHKRYATLVTSRGCPFKCSYCTKSVSGEVCRFQSAERIVKEMEFLISENNIKQVHFYDDNFTINANRINEFCDFMIKKSIKVKWSCVTRVDLVNEELLNKMKKTGCWLISYGVESGNQKILDGINRGYNINQLKNAFFLTRKAGMRTLGYFMAGLPGETRKTLNDTVNLSFLLNPDFVSWSITALYPGSELYEMALNGRLGDNYTQIKTPLIENASNVSSLSPYAQGYAYIYEGGIPREDILKIVNDAYRKFYFRFSYLVRFFIKLQTFTELFSYLSVFKQFLKWRNKTTGTEN